MAGWREADFLDRARWRRPVTRKRTKRRCAGSVADEAEDVMTSGEQQAGERYAEGAVGPGDQDFHGFLP